MTPKGQKVPIRMSEANVCLSQDKKKKKGNKHYARKHWTGATSFQAGWMVVINTMCYFHMFARYLPFLKTLSGFFWLMKLYSAHHMKQCATTNCSLSMKVNMNNLQHQAYVCVLYCCRQILSSETANFKKSRQNRCISKMHTLSKAIAHMYKSKASKVS